jgi:putative FmdB family regulatory protein
MPTYEYGCAACGSEWEEIQRITAPPIEVCPKCGKSAAHRLISAGGGFILKGGGWYSDLYSSAKPAANKDDTKGATSTDAAPKAEGGATKSESPAAKTESKADTKPATAAPATTPSSGGTSSAA